MFLASVAFLFAGFLQMKIQVNSQLVKIELSHVTEMSQALSLVGTGGRNTWGWKKRERTRTSRASSYPSLRSTFSRARRNNYVRRWSKPTESLEQVSFLMGQLIGVVLVFSPHPLSSLDRSCVVCRCNFREERAE